MKLLRHLRIGRTRETHAASLLESVLDATADGLLVVGASGRIVTWNRRFAELWRIPREILDSRDDEAALRFVLDQLEDPEAFLDKVRTLYTDAEAESFDVLPLRDGRILERFSIPQRVNGVPVGRVWSFRDVTARTRIEESLRESERRYRTLVERNLAGVFRSTLDGRMLECNDSLVRILGYSSREELATVPAASVYADPADRDDLIADILRVGYVTNREIRGRRKDGTIVWVLETISLATDEATGETCLEGALIDISEKRRRNDELRKSEEYFRALIEHASDGIFVIGRSGRIRYVSPSMFRILGYTPADLMGKQSRDFAHPEDLDRVAAALSSGISAPGSTASLVCRVRHKDGSWRSVEAVASNLSEITGVTGVVVNLRDVTERLILEKQLEAANHLSGLGRLAATIAHEFNNVLMGIQPFAEVIGRTTERKTIDSATARIVESVQRGKRIAQQILRYTRPAEPTLAAIDLRDWMGRLREELRVLVGPQIELDVEIPGDPLFMLADRMQISQTLTNLALNAADAMPAGGRLSVSVREAASWSTFNFGVVTTPDRFVHFTVRDTGAGIEPTHLGRIFEPLFSTKNEGTGLGLTVVRQIVAAHGGEIFVESTPGSGTTFHLFIPKTLPELLDSGEKQEDVHERDGEGRGRGRILIVEDDGAVAAGLQALLDVEGYETELVGDGAGVEAKMLRFAPDALIMDLGLPDTDGVTLYRALSRRWPDLPVVFSTGHGDEHQMNELLALPNVRFLQKPYGCDELFELLESLLAS